MLRIHHTSTRLGFSSNTPKCSTNCDKCQYR